MKSILAIVVLLVLGARAQAQPFAFSRPAEISLSVQFDQADNVARSHLERIDRFLEAGGWDEAIETLRRVMDTDGEKMIPVTGDQEDEADVFTRFVTLRDYCQMKLAGLHASAPEALDLYRSRVDPLTERWYTEAVADNKRALLQRIVNRFCVSSCGDDALFRLGEIELERGNYTLARAHWERISPLFRTTSSQNEVLRAAGDRPLWLALRDVDLRAHWETIQPLLTQPVQPTGWLAYPDTDLDLSEVLARLTLVSILEGSIPRAEVELVLIEQLHGDAEGEIGGRRGRYADLLADLLERSRSWVPRQSPRGWMTFGGSPTRAVAAAGGVDVALRPVWTAPLPVRRVVNQGDSRGGGESRVAEDGAGLLSYHPLIVDNMVVVCTGEGIEDVHAFDLHTGRPQWPAQTDAAHHEDTKEEEHVRPTEPRGQYGVPRYLMTAYEKILYVKLGLQATTVPHSDRHDPLPPGHLAALDLDAEKKRLFEIHLSRDEWGDGWAFEGAPLVDDGNLYIALRRRGNLRAQAHVACFRIKPNRAELRWRKFIAAAETLGQGQHTEYTHTMLTLDQGVLFVNTNLGAVAALAPETGEIRWITRYPRAPIHDKDPDRSRLHLFRDLNPCLVHKDLVIAAPTDSDLAFALDVATGIVLWSTGPQRAVDAVHLLGVGGGHLIASGHRLYWIDIHNGRIVSSFPARVQDALRGFGRGILAGQQVYWPTRERIYIFDQCNMRQTRQPIDLAPIGMTGGNLVIVDGVLLIASAGRLAAFDSSGRQFTKTEAAP